jgi:hypothetical protein
MRSELLYNIWQLGTMTVYTEPRTKRACGALPWLLSMIAALRDTPLAQQAQSVKRASSRSLHVPDGTVESIS